jgi:hypothetical protein
MHNSNNNTNNNNNNSVQFIYLRAWQQPDVANYSQAQKQQYRLIIIQFNSVQFFIISVLHQQPEGQLQMQHKGIQDNKYNKITI